LERRCAVQILRFGIAGIPGVTLYFFLYGVLTRWFGIWYIAATILVGTITWSITFYCQKRWTFKNKETKRLKSQIMIYALKVLVIVFALAPIILFLLVEKLHIFDFYAQGGVLLATSTFSFLVDKYVIFRN
jgi:putative flippase GtrA